MIVSLAPNESGELILTVQAVSAVEIALLGNWQLLASLHQCRHCLHIAQTATAAEARLELALAPDEYRRPPDEGRPAKLEPIK